MVYAPFDPLSVSLDDFEQEGSGFYYYGLPFQRGYGIGSLFRGFLRMLIKSKAGRTVGKEALVTSAKILDNIVQGSDLKETIVNEAKQGIKRLANQQSGGGPKRKKRKVVKKKKKKITRKMVLGKRVLGGLALQKPTKSRLGFF